MAWQALPRNLPVTGPCPCVTPTCSLLQSGLGSSPSSISVTLVTPVEDRRLRRAWDRPHCTGTTCFPFRWAPCAPSAPWQRQAPRLRPSLFFFFVHTWTQHYYHYLCRTLYYVPFFAERFWPTARSYRYSLLSFRQIQNRVYYTVRGYRYLRPLHQMRTQHPGFVAL